MDLPSDLLSEEQAVRDVVGAEQRLALSGGGYWPTMFQLGGNTLAAVLRCGSPHVGLHSRLDLIRSDDGGRRWTATATVVPEIPGGDVRGSAAGVMADGAFVVGYWENTQYRGAKFDPSVGQCRPYYVRSEDNGRTWSAKRPLRCKRFPRWFVTYGRICALPDGTALMPVYGPTHAGSDICAGAVLRSTDNGRSWHDGTVIADGTNETSIVHLPDGRLLAFLRTESPEFSRNGAVSQCESADLGFTWSEPTQLTRPHQHPADACLLASGNLLLTYGNRIGELAVGAMLSRDLGRTWNWERRVVLARDSLTLRGKQWGDCGYPSTVQLDDGTIVTLYYRLGHSRLPADQQELCRQYERDTFDHPPASEDMRRFEEAVCVRCTEAQLG